MNDPQKNIFLDFGIDKFSGIWVSDDGYKLVIYKVTDTTAIVSFYSPKGTLVNRPFFKNKPTIKMPATYDEYFGDFKVDLWEPGKGFELDLEHEKNYELYQSQKEVLIPGIIRFTEDNFLDKYYKIFVNLHHFSKVGDESN
jgi:hypothetical protein